MAVAPLTCRLGMVDGIFLGEHFVSLLLAVLVGHRACQNRSSSA